MLLNCYCFNFDTNCRSETITTFDFSHPAKLIRNFSTYYLSDLDVIPSEYMIDLLRELDDRAFSIQEISKNSGKLRELNSVDPFISDSSCRLSFKLVIVSTVYSVILIKISTNNHVILVKRDK